MSVGMLQLLSRVLGRASIFEGVVLASVEWDDEVAPYRSEKCVSFLILSISLL